MYIDILLAYEQRCQKTQIGVKHLIFTDLLQEANFFKPFMWKLFPKGSYDIWIVGLKKRKKRQFRATSQYGCIAKSCKCITSFSRAMIIKVEWRFIHNVKLENFSLESLGSKATFLLFNVSDGCFKPNCCHRNRKLQWNRSHSLTLPCVQRIKSWSNCVHVTSVEIQGVDGSYSWKGTVEKKIWGFYKPREWEGKQSSVKTCPK